MNDKIIEVIELKRDRYKNFAARFGRQAKYAQAEAFVQKANALNEVLADIKIIRRML